MTKSELFKSIHADVRRIVVEQKEYKHSSAWRSYADIFASCLRGHYIIEAHKRYVPVEKPKFMWLRGM